MACSCGNTCSNCRKSGGRAKRKGGSVRTKKQAGGYLRGPKHERGGIPANLQNGGQVELEGGEYIINAQTVSAVGTEYLDKLNSTATTYHQGGFQQGQLGYGSNYRKGGRIKSRKMQSGGFTGRTDRQCIRHQMPDGTIMEGPTHGAGQTCIEWSNGRKNMARRDVPRSKVPRSKVPRRRQSSTNRNHQSNMLPNRGTVTNNYRKGGRVRKFQTGGHTHSLPSHRHFVQTSGDGHGEIVQSGYTSPTSYSGRADYPTGNQYTNPLEKP